jgi:hypothetical protein
MWTEPPSLAPGEMPERESRLLSIVLGIPPIYLKEVLEKPLRLPKDIEGVLRSLFEEKGGALPIRASTKGKGQTLIGVRQAIAYRLGVMDSLITPRRALLYASLGDPGLREIMRGHIMGQREELLEGKVGALLGLEGRFPYDRYIKLLGRYLPVPLLEVGAWQRARKRLLAEAPLTPEVREALLQAVSLEDFKKRLSGVSVSRSVKSRLVTRLKNWVYL